MVSSCDRHWGVCWYLDLFFVDSDGGGERGKTWIDNGWSTSSLTGAEKGVGACFLLPLSDVKSGASRSTQEIGPGGVLPR